MTLSSFAAYIKQLWRNKPDTSTPVTAERLAHMEEGIKGNSDAIEEIAAAVVSQIINDPDKIASMAAVYAVNQKVATLDGKVGDTAQLPDGATDVVTAIAKQNSDLGYLGEIREAYLSTAITPQSGQTYTIGSLSLETGKWLLFGATLAGGDLIIDGNIISRLNGRNANINSWYESSIYAFAVSNGGIVNLKLLSNGFGILHADKTYCGLTAVRIG